MSKNFFLGILVGTITGAILGVLFAPKSGKETRRDIEDFTIEIKNRISDKISMLGKVTKEKYKSIVEETLSDYEKQKKIKSEQAEDLKQELMDKYNKIKDIIES